MDELLKDFLVESGEHIEGAETQILQFERDPTNAGLIASIFRLVHTIKGTSGFLGLERLQRVGHAAETVIGQLRDGATATPHMISLILRAIDRIKWILAEVDRLGEEPQGSDDDIINALHDSENDKTEPPPPVVTVVAVEPEVLAGGSDAHAESDEDDETADPSPAVASVSTLPGASAPQQRKAKEDGGARGQETIRVAVDTIESIMQLVSELVLTRNQLVELTRRRENDVVKAPLQRLSALTTDLQDAVMRARMQPVERLYANLPRLVRELSAELGKKLVLTTEGADTEVDRQLIEVIRDPLTHLIRNCADHGIETPEARIAVGKPEAGEIRVSASHQGGHITIEIGDDGRGLDPQKLAAKAISSGMLSAEEVRGMSNEDIYRLIFEAGFSTAQAVTNVSGRGVGMDVVRSNIESIGGTVSIASTLGRGAQFSLKIPLTLAIAPALIIETGGQRFALPQHCVVEVVGLGAQSRHNLEKVQNALVLRLRQEVLPAVDLSALLGIERPLSAERLAVITRLGTNSFAIIVDDVADVQEIVVKPLSASLAHLKVFSGRTILGDGSVVLILDASGIATRIGIDAAADKRRDTQKKPQERSDRTRLVMFRAGPGCLKALPLSVISRIEMVPLDKLKEADGKLVVLHHGRLMPVVPLAGSHPSSVGATCPLLVVGQDQTAVGLQVDEIVDIVEEQLFVQLEGSSRECVGTAEIRGEPVEILDIAYLLEVGQTGCRQPLGAGSVLLASEGGAFRDVFAPVLAAAGYSVHSAQSATDAASLLDLPEVFDAVLLDCDLDETSRRSWLQFFAALGLNCDRLIGLSSGARVTTRSGADPGMRDMKKADRRALLETLAVLVEARRTAQACAQTSTTRKDRAA